MPVCSRIAAGQRRRPAAPAWVRNPRWRLARTRCHAGRFGRGLRDLAAQEGAFSVSGVHVSLKRTLKRARASAGNDVEGRIADVDAGHLEVRRLEIRRALVELERRQAREDAHQRRDRVVGEMRIGDVALLAGDRDRRRQAAAPADLDRVAEPRRARSARRRARRRSGGRVRCAQSSSLTVPLIDGPFLVAGDEQRQRAVGLPPLAMKPRAAAMKARDAALHVHGAAAVEAPSAISPANGGCAPARLVARRHDVGMAGEDQMRRAARRSWRTDSRRPACPAPRRSARSTAKPARVENLGQIRQRAAFRRRHRAAGDQRLQKGGRVDELGHDVGDRRRERRRFSEAFACPSIGAETRRRAVERSGRRSRA